MAENESLHVGIDASGAKAGADQYKAALTSIGTAVEAFDKKTSAAFDKINGKFKNVDFTAISRAVSQLNGIRVNPALASGIDSISRALGNFRAPSDVQVRNLTAFGHALSVMRTPNIDVSRIAGLSAALRNFHAPTPAQTANLTHFIHEINNVQVNQANFTRVEAALNRIGAAAGAATAKMQGLATASASVRPPRGMGGGGGGGGSGGGGGLRGQYGPRGNTPYDGVFSGSERATGELRGLENVANPSFQGASIIRSMVPALTAGSMMEGLFSEGAKLTQFQHVLEVVTKGQGELNSQMQIASDVSYKYGLNLDTTREGFSHFLVNMKMAGYSTGDADHAFVALSSSMRALGTDATRQDQVWRALNTTLANGKVMSTQLTRQFDQALPGFKEVLAQVVYMQAHKLDPSTVLNADGRLDAATQKKAGQELTEDLKKGKVSPAAIVGEGGALDLLQKQTEKGLPTALNSPVAALERLKTAWKETMDMMNSPLGGNVWATMGEEINHVAQILHTTRMQEFFKELGQGMAAALHQMGNAVEWASNHLSELTLAFKIFLALGIYSSAMSIGGAFFRMGSMALGAVQGVFGLVTAMKAMQAAQVGMGSALTGIGGGASGVSRLALMSAGFLGLAAAIGVAAVAYTAYNEAGDASPRFPEHTNAEVWALEWDNAKKSILADFSDMGTHFTSMWTDLDKVFGTGTKLSSYFTIDKQIELTLKDLAEAMHEVRDAWDALMDLPKNMEFVATFTWQAMKDEVEKAKEFLRKATSPEERSKAAENGPDNDHEQTMNDRAEQAKRDALARGQSYQIGIDDMKKDTRQGVNDICDIHEQGGLKIDQVTGNMMAKLNQEISSGLNSAQGLFGQFAAMASAQIAGIMGSLSALPAGFGGANASLPGPRTGKIPEVLTGDRSLARQLDDAAQARKAAADAAGEAAREHSRIQYNPPTSGPQPFLQEGSGGGKKGPKDKTENQLDELEKGLGQGIGEIEKFLDQKKILDEALAKGMVSKSAASEGLTAQEAYTRDMNALKEKMLEAVNASTAYDKAQNAVAKATGLANGMLKEGLITQQQYDYAIAKTTEAHLKAISPITEETNKIKEQNAALEYSGKQRAVMAALFKASDDATKAGAPQATDAQNDALARQIQLQEKLKEYQSNQNVGLQVWANSFKDLYTQMGMVEQRIAGDLTDALTKFLDGPKEFAKNGGFGKMFKDMQANMMHDVVGNGLSAASQLIGLTGPKGTDPTGSAIGGGISKILGLGDDGLATLLGHKKPTQADTTGMSAGMKSALAQYAENNALRVVLAGAPGTGGAAGNISGTAGALIGGPSPGNSGSATAGGGGGGGITGNGASAGGGTSSMSIPGFAQLISGKGSGGLGGGSLNSFLTGGGEAEKGSYAEAFNKGGLLGMAGKGLNSLFSKPSDGVGTLPSTTINSQTTASGMSAASSDAANAATYGSTSGFGTASAASTTAADATAGAADASSGGLGGLLSSIGTGLSNAATNIGTFFAGLFEEGGYSEHPVKKMKVGGTMYPYTNKNFAGTIPHYAEGTENTSGGGMPAMLHPDEAVIPLSRGRRIPIEVKNSGGDAGSRTAPNITMHIHTPDADSFRKSMPQIHSDMLTASTRSAQRNGR